MLLTMPHVVLRHIGLRHACCVAALALLLPAFGSATAGTRVTADKGTQATTDAFEDAVTQAQAAQSAGQYAVAAAAYTKATALNPAIPELWANRGLMEHLAGQPKDAIASFAHALAARPNLFTAVLFTGIDLAALNQPARAIPWLDRALHLQPANPDALIALGKACITTGHLERATSTLEMAVTAAPTSSAAWFSLAVARLALIDRDGGPLARDHATDPWSEALYAQDLLVQGRTSEAVNALRQAAAGANPRQRAIFAALLSFAASAQSELPPQSTARALAAVAEAGAAAPLPCPATSALPHDTMPCSYLGGDARAAAAYLATDRLDQAIATARTALTTQPDNPRLNLLLGQALIEQHHFIEARPPVDRALSAATSSNLTNLVPSAHALLGQIKADAGDLPGAIADLTLGLPSDTDGSLSFRLSRLYRRQGQLALATETEAHGKDLLASRRAHAVTAVETSSEVSP